ncbi:MAG: hypothetical protein R6U64_02950 [Bacteroidales bacterium]
MKKSIVWVFACMILFSCDSEIEEPKAANDMRLSETKSMPVQNCVNVHVQDVFYFGGPISFDFSGMTDLFDALKAAGAFDVHSVYGNPMAGFEGFTVFGGGAFPIGTTVAGVEGMLGSIVTHQYAANENAAVFIHLFHFFESDEGAFITWDHAVQSPLNPQNYTARINNKMEILAGTGVFANASGKLINNGMINYGAEPPEIHANVHGRICADGLGKEH